MAPPQVAIAVALAVASLSSSVNHAFSPPLASAASSPPSLLKSLSLSTTAVGSDPGSDEVMIDGRSLLDGVENSKETSPASAQRQRSLLQRLIKRDGGAIRGDRYGTSNNSTILAPADAAIKVGVEPTLEATKEEWKRAWKIHRFAMKVLHRFDGCRPKDSKLALACLWWKALAGNDAASPVYDHQLSYDLLPPVARWVVSRRLCGLYPRLHHANVEIRTAYLDKSVANVIHAITNEAATNTTDDATPDRDLNFFLSSPSTTPKLG